MNLVGLALIVVASYGAYRSIKHVARWIWR